MKTIKIVSTVLFICLVCGMSISHAQFRKNKPDISEYRGPIFKKGDPSDGAKLSNLFNMTMDHSYTMMFGSTAGHYQNLNVYTNTMRFYFTDKLTGRVDLSILHSPFGSGKLAGTGAEQGIEFVVRNAELNYELSKNATIHIRYRQIPDRLYRMGGVGRFGRFNRFSPFPSLLH